jgi:hypothetical protein
MFKRSRRSTLCHVEQLEERAALASAVVDSAVVIGGLDKVVHLRGYVTNVGVGQDLTIYATQTHPSTGIRPYTVVRVEHPVDRRVPDQSGSFFGSIRAERSWHVGGELTVDVYQMLDPESTPQRYLLATEHIRITLD